LMYGDGGFRDAFMASSGQDDGTTHLGNASSDAAGFGVKFVVGGSSGVYSVIVDHTQAGFGGYILVKATVTSITATGFTLTYDLNDTSASNAYPYFVAGQSFMVVALGGADLDVAMGIPASPTTIGFELAGLISRRQILGSGTATGTGAGDTGQIGWTTAAGVQGCIGTFTVNQGPVYGYTATDRVTCALTDTGTVTSGQVTAITPTAFSTNAAYSGSYLAVGGTNIVTASGVFTQSPQVGEQTINLGINASVVLFASAGTTTDDRGVVQTGEFQLLYGALTSDTTGCSVWCGNIGTNPAAPLGGRYVSDASLLRFGTPDGASTTFTSVVSGGTLSSQGACTLQWASTDAVPRDIIWFAIGEAAVNPTPTYYTVPIIERRLRQAPHLVSELQRQFISKFQIHLQAGIGQGNAQGADPMVMFSYSKNGGRTWSNERRLSAGKVGQIARRCLTWRLGTARDWVFRVSVTDPNVPWALIAAYLEGDEGSH